MIESADHVAPLKIPGVGGRIERVPEAGVEKTDGHKVAGAGKEFLWLIRGGMRTRQYRSNDHPE